MAETTTQQQLWSSGARPRCRSPVGLSLFTFMCFHLISRLTTCSKNVTFDCYPLLFFFCRGALFGARQGDWSRWHASRFAARIRSGPAESSADNSTVWKELRRRRNQVSDQQICSRSLWLMLLLGCCGSYFHVCVAVYPWSWRMFRHPVVSQWKSFLIWLWLHSSNRSEIYQSSSNYDMSITDFHSLTPTLLFRCFSSTASIPACSAGWSVSACAPSRGRWPPTGCRRTAIQRTCTWSLPDKPGSPASCSSRTWRAPSSPHLSRQATAPHPKTGGDTAPCPRGSPTTTRVSAANVSVLSQNGFRI